MNATLNVTDYAARHQAYLELRKMEDKAKDAQENLKYVASAVDRGHTSLEEGVQQFGALLQIEGGYTATQSAQRSFSFLSHRTSTLQKSLPQLVVDYASLRSRVRNVDDAIEHFKLVVLMSTKTNTAFDECAAALTQALERLPSDPDKSNTKIACNMARLAFDKLGTPFLDALELILTLSESTMHFKKIGTLSKSIVELVRTVGLEHLTLADAFEAAALLFDEENPRNRLRILGTMRLLSQSVVEKKHSSLTDAARSFGELRKIEVAETGAEAKMTDRVEQAFSAIYDLPEQKYY